MSSERPLILIGSQAVRAQGTDALRSALESLGVPVYLSGMGRGLLV
jgi:thiamine pyrophosphate-dependent acetolactate synthase large subunit-like protein